MDVASIVIASIALVFALATCAIVKFANDARRPFLEVDTERLHPQHSKSGHEEINVKLINHGECNAELGRIFIQPKGALDKRLRVDITNYGMLQVVTDAIRAELNPEYLIIVSQIDYSIRAIEAKNQKLIFSIHAIGPDESIVVPTEPPPVTPEAYMRSVYVFLETHEIVMEVRQRGLFGWYWREEAQMLDGSHNIAMETYLC